MSTYIFILGKDPELSIAELEARYPSSELVTKNTSFWMAKLGSDLNQAEFNRLGGQIKAGEVQDRVSKKNLTSSIADRLSADHYSGKLNYGVSVYGWSEKNLRLLLLDLKKEFKRRGISSRFANQNFKNISAAQSKGLKGPEIIVAKNGDDYYLAMVLAVQNIDAYSKRDFKKPFRSMKVGMLPPKLAQIMINLAGDAERIWDPFCGGGVLLMEGLLMGRKMLGSDIDTQTLEGAKKNVDWTIREFGLSASADVFLHDATEPRTDKKFDAIVFEGYLGPPQSRQKSEAELEPVLNELNHLYVRFFGTLKKSGFKGPIVIGLPFFRTRQGDLHLSKVIRKADVLGFKKELNLKYAREDQLVGRDIYRFKST